MTSLPRVAFLPDTFHEVNGVAHTSRQLEAFVRRRRLPFLSVHAGQCDSRLVDGPFTSLQLARGPAKFALDANLDYDPLFFRHKARVEAELREFGPDLIHITGPGDLGTLGLWLARRMKIPLVISWHTSLHQYAGGRLERLANFLGDNTSQFFGSLAEDLSLKLLRAFYRQAAMILAPNQELIGFMRELADKPTYLMSRGVDTHLFTPSKRTRTAGGKFRIGYVGRLTPEKNVRFFGELSRGLDAQGLTEFEIVVVGEGSEEQWLKENVPQAVFTGVLRGEDLAREFANFDLFAFPSTTDTFGNVILEALASGVPCVVTNSGGPRFLVAKGVNGHVAADDKDFVDFVGDLLRAPEKVDAMRIGARDYALKQSWDGVFESLFQAYATLLPMSCAA